MALLDLGVDELLNLGCIGLVDVELAAEVASYLIDLIVAVDADLLQGVLDLYINNRNEWVHFFFFLYFYVLVSFKHLDNVAEKLAIVLSSFFLV